MGRMFGTDGVRGIANKDLTSQMAYNLGRAGAYVLTEGAHKPKILVAKDTRISGDMLEAALVAGILSVGAEAVILGVDQSKGEAQTCNHNISIDLFSFGIDTATEDGKKIANGIADYLMDSGYNASIDNNGDHHASLIIDLSATKDQNKED